MSSAKRYEFEVDDRYLCDCGNGSRVIPVAIDTGKYVLASDYDRDTQALREDRDSQQRACINVMADRDQLRAQVATLQSDANSWQSGYDKGRRDGAKHRQDEVKSLSAQIEAMRLLLEDILQADDEAIEGLSALGVEPGPQTTQLTERIRTALQAKP